MMCSRRCFLERNCTCSQHAWLSSRSFHVEHASHACRFCFAVTGTHVTPVVGFLDVDPSSDVLAPSAAEVASVFTLPLSGFASPSCRVIEPIPMRKPIPRPELVALYGVTAMPDGSEHVNMPSFYGGPARIWGLTALIWDQLLQDVFAMKFKKHGS